LNPYASIFWLNLFSIYGNATISNYIMVNIITFKWHFYKFH